MKCPFLSEAHVKSCQNSPFRKLLPMTEREGSGEKCHSEMYRECAAYRESGFEAAAGQCPYLREELVQFCSAASVPKFVPYSEAVLIRCGTERYRYCDVYAMRAEPRRAQDRSDGSWVDDIHVPKALSYTPNHMWMDAASDGVCHVGIDGFLARVLGSVERISFVTQRGVNLPTAVLTVNGVDLSMVFPVPMELTGANLHLRSHPERLTSDPYRLGWLFEGVRTKEQQGQGIAEDSLLPGAEALQWIKREVERMSAMVHEYVSRPVPGEETLMADGGAFAAGVARHLEREQILEVFNRFFSPYLRRTER